MKELSVHSLDLKEYLISSVRRALFSNVTRNIKYVVADLLGNKIKKFERNYMKIIYISNSIIPSRSANSIHVMKMCQSFASLGHEVILLAPDFCDEYEKNILDDFSFYNVEKTFKLVKLKVPKIKGKTFLYTLKIFLYLINNKSDLVYGRFILGCYLSTFIKRKTVFESHSSIYKDNKLSQNIFNKLIRSSFFKKLVVISQKLKDIYIEEDIISEKIFVAHDGADEVKNLEEKISLKEYGKLNIGYIGHLYEGKGMEVIEQIAPKLPDFRFHIVGGTLKDIEYWSEKMNFKNVFFYGFVRQDLVQKYINSMDICLLPNQNIIFTHGDSKQNISEYTSPLKMFEYMASKKAIIASDLPVLKEVLTPKNAYLVGYNDYDNWIDAIHVLENENIRKEKGMQAYQDFKVNYSWKQRAKNILKAIE